jgi:CBS domain-containing protein
LKTPNLLQFITPKADVVFINENMTVRQALEKMDYNKYSVVPVIDEQGLYLGTISEGDLLRFIKNQNSFNISKAESIKINKLPTYRSYKASSINASLTDILNLSISQNFVPLTDDRGVFIGIIKRATILNFLIGFLDENKDRLISD